MADEKDKPQQPDKDKDKDKIEVRIVTEMTALLNLTADTGDHRIS